MVQSVEGMKVVCHELSQTMNDPDGSAMDDVLKDADRLVSCLANKVPTTLTLTQFLSNVTLASFFAPVRF